MMPRIPMLNSRKRAQGHKRMYLFWYKATFMLPEVVPKVGRCTVVLQSAHRPTLWALQ